MEAKVSQIPEEENRHVQAKLVLGQENKDIYLQPYRGIKHKYQNSNHDILLTNSCKLTGLSAETYVIERRKNAFQ